MSAADPTPQELADYIADNYGRCRAPRCFCRDPGPWLGRACNFWVSVTARNWEELRQIHKKINGKPHSDG